MKKKTLEAFKKRIVESLSEKKKKEEEKNVERRKGGGLLYRRKLECRRESDLNRFEKGKKGGREPCAEGVRKKKSPYFKRGESRGRKKICEQEQHRMPCRKQEKRRLSQGRGDRPAYLVS